MGGSSAPQRGAHSVPQPLPPPPAANVPHHILNLILISPPSFQQTAISSSLLTFEELRRMAAVWIGSLRGDADKDSLLIDLEAACTRCAAPGCSSRWLAPPAEEDGRSTCLRRPPASTRLPSALPPLPPSHDCCRFGLVDRISLQCTSRSPAGNYLAAAIDHYAIVRFRDPSAAAAAREGLHGRAIPALTARTLKTREWVEQPQPPQQQQQQQQQYGGGPRTPPPPPGGRYDEVSWQERTSWGRPGAASRTAALAPALRGREQERLWATAEAVAADGRDERAAGQSGTNGVAEAHEEDAFAADYGDDDDDGEDPTVELWVGNLAGCATAASVRRAFEW